MFEFLYSDTKRAEKYLEFEKSLKELDLEISELARTFNSTIKDFRIAALSTDDIIVKSSIRERSEFFKRLHLKSVGEAKRKRDKLTKSMQTLKTDSTKFIEVIEKSKKKEAFDTILKSYRDGLISISVCDSLIKAKTKEKARYADNIVINEKGLILLLKRSEIDDSHPGYYTVPGGHVDLGEDFEIAAKRELQEEAGIKIEEVIKVGEYEDEKCRIEYFQSHVENIEPVLQEEEIWSYEWVEPKDIKNYKLPFNMGENLMKILFPFREQIIQIKKSFEIGTINVKTRDNLIGVVIEKAKSSDLEKAWKVAQIGEIRTHGDGKKYKKVSETGNSLKDWQLVTDSKTGNSQEDTNGKQRNKQDTTEKQPTAKELVEHAKKTSETSLNTAIKESEDPKLRKVAHNELERRQKEEKPEEKDVKKESGEKIEEQTNKSIKKSEDNQLKGGKSDNLTIQDIADKHKVSVEDIKKQLQIGIKIEMEHTDDPRVAVEIARDHLYELSDYYTRLEKMEDEGKKESKQNE